MLNDEELDKIDKQREDENEYKDERELEFMKLCLFPRISQSRLENEVSRGPGDMVWIPIRAGSSSSCSSKRSSLIPVRSRQNSWTSWEEGERNSKRHSISGRKLNDIKDFIEDTDNDERIVWDEETELENIRLLEEEEDIRISEAIAQGKKPVGVKRGSFSSPKRGPSLKRWLESVILGKEPEAE
jgi:hypothetical protein